MALFAPLFFPLEEEKLYQQIVEGKYEFDVAGILSAEDETWRRSKLVKMAHKRLLLLFFEGVLMSFLSPVGFL